MGKKLVIGYENSFMQAWDSPTARGTSVTGDGVVSSFFSFNATHSLGAEYVTGRKRTFGLSFKYLHTGAFAPGTPYSMIPRRDHYGIITAYGVGLRTKRFNKKYIAPWGVYRELEVFMLFHRFEHFYPEKYFPVQPDKIVYPMFYNAGISFAFGKQRVIKDILTLNYGARLGLIFKRDYYNAYDFPELSDDERNIKKISGDRLFNHQIVNITLGLGYLAY